MALITVIIPVYNGEKTILSTIESVINQTFYDFELVVINDGSTDSTLEIINSIADSRLQVFSYFNAGLSVSRNRGISHAKSEYISFIDADDLWTTDKLETQLRALQDNPQASVAYSWTDYIDEQGNFIVSGSHITVNGYVYNQLLVNNFLENGSNPLILKQALIEVGEFAASFSPAEDWDMWLRLAARYAFVAVPLPQILYRVSATSLSANLLKMEIACLQVINHAIARASEPLDHLKAHSIANLYKYLTCKALQEPLNRHKGIVACRFLWQFFWHDVLRFQHLSLTLKLLFKIFLIIILSPAWSTALLKNIQTNTKKNIKTNNQLIVDI